MPWKVLVDGSWIVPLETVSGVAARGYASDLLGRFVMSGPSRRGVDAANLWTHETASDLTQHV